MQNCIEVPDFLTGLVWETRMTLSIQKTVLSLQSEALSSVPSLSEGAVTASGSAQWP